MRSLTICIVTPTPPGSRKGNRVTAERWGRLLIELGHKVEISVDYHDQTCDVLVALHALKSHASIRRFRDRSPDVPLVLCLTGTDLYGDIHHSPEAVESLELATRLVLLQPLGRTELPPHLQAKARVIYQSVEVPTVREAARQDIFEVCVMGHLRPVKDPFRTARAAQLLPPSSRVQVLQLGGALSDDMAEQARTLAATSQRYQWMGELPWSEAMKMLSRCRLLSLTSELEGGANVISEAVMLGVPVVASRIAGSIGLLGEDYPGYYPVHDTQALAELLLRAETDTAFYRFLVDRCAERRPLFEPAAERESWQRLLVELTVVMSLG
jgi:putative glycosyltransferase (TIGR04348 family)